VRRRPWDQEKHGHENHDQGQHHDYGVVQHHPRPKQDFSKRNAGKSMQSRGLGHENGTKETKHKLNGHNDKSNDLQAIHLLRPKLHWARHPFQKQ